MIATLQKIWQTEELKKKIIFTLTLLLVCRVGVFIPVPGINGEVALNYFKQMTGGEQNLFQLVNIFSGGAFSQMTVTALSVVPYISASIIMQLLVALLPGLQREVKENPNVGRRKITKWTRLFTLALAGIQSALFARFAIQMNLSFPGIIGKELLNFELFGLPILFYVVVMMTMTTGTLFLMWIGEQITEHGIGNGMSMIIMLGILSQLPTAMGLIFQQLNLDSQDAGTMTFATVMVLLGVFISVTMATILIIQGQRRIPLQYARRVVGMKEVQASGNPYIPLKVNYAGVIPVIFASSLLVFPATVGQFIGKGNWFADVVAVFYPGSKAYLITFVLMIIFFTYFWTATQFHPDQIASDMKKNGAFIPGVRQGMPTQVYLEQTMNRITLIGALFLSLIAVLPTIIGRAMSIPSTISYFFGGTALLILVGVFIDTAKQVESHLMMKKYDGFMKKGRGRIR